MSQKELLLLLLLLTLATRTLDFDALERVVDEEAAVVFAAGARRLGESDSARRGESSCVKGTCARLQPQARVRQKQHAGPATRKTHLSSHLHRKTKKTPPCFSCRRDSGTGVRLLPDSCLRQKCGARARLHSRQRRAPAAKTTAASSSTARSRALVIAPAPRR